MSVAHDPAAPAATIGDGAAAPAVAEPLLNAVLFITVLTSCIAFIEPSPHDALIFVLLAACIVARVRFDRKLLPVPILLILWLTGGCLSLIQVGDQKNAIQYVGTSIYLSIAAVTFACLFSDGSLIRLGILRRAYLIAALIATAAGYAGFFHLVPGSDMFLFADRVSATFKDPNVYGPFLIFPVILSIVLMLSRGIRLVDLMITLMLASGIFLSFSRGAWGHFGTSALVAFVLLVVVAPTPRLRARILLFAAVAVICTLLLVVALLSIESIHNLFLERARLIQYYDVGPGGRFSMQELAPQVILDNPFGIGPFEFDRIYGLATHNSYLQSFLLYGWVGGAAYVTLVAITLLVGLRGVLMPSPWQPYLLAAYATFVGEVGEGFIVDTEHWRHFFLLLGLVWGLTVANINLYRREAWRRYAEQPAAALQSV